MWHDTRWMDAPGKDDGTRFQAITPVNHLLGMPRDENSIQE